MLPNNQLKNKHGGCKGKNISSKKRSRENKRYLSKNLKLKICAYPPCKFMIQENQTYCKRHVSMMVEKLENEKNYVKNCIHNGCKCKLSITSPHTYCNMHLERQRKFNKEQRIQKKRKIIESEIADKEFAKWLAGFLDGDGCISMYCDENKSGYSLTVSFSQGDERIFYEILKQYPGAKLNCQIRKDRKDGCKPEFKLSYHGLNACKILGDVQNYIIIKDVQVQLAIEFLYLLKSHDERDKEHKEEIYQSLKSLKNYDQNNQSLKFDRLCDEYVAGLFDAEGCVKLYKSQCIQLTQKNNIPILKHIALHYHGHVNVPKLLLWDKFEIKDFIQRLQPYLSIKRIQCEILVDYINGRLSKPDAQAMIHNDKHFMKLNFPSKPINMGKTILYQSNQSNYFPNSTNHNRIFYVDLNKKNTVIQDRYNKFKSFTRK